jgi:hypothetical protein
MRACVRACAFAIKPLDFCQLLSMGLCKINKLALAVIEVLLHVCVPVFVVRVPVQCVCAFACVCWHVCVPVFVVCVPVQCVCVGMCVCQCLLCVYLCNVCIFIHPIMLGSRVDQQK